MQLASTGMSRSHFVTRIVGFFIVATSAKQLPLWRRLQLDRFPAFRVVVGHLIDPRADWIATHQPRLGQAWPDQEIIRCQAHLREGASLPVHRKEERTMSRLRG